MKYPYGLVCKRRSCSRLGRYAILMASGRWSPTMCRRCLDQAEAALGPSIWADFGAADLTN